MMRGAHLSRPAPLPRREGAVLPHRKGQNTNCATQAAHGQACMRARTSEALAQGQGCWFSISLIVRDAPPRSFSLSSSARRQGASTSASLALRRFDSRGHGIFLATRKPRGREGRGGERQRHTETETETDRQTVRVRQTDRALYSRPRGHWLRSDSDAVLERKARQLVWQRARTLGCLQGGEGDG